MERNGLTLLKGGLDDRHNSKMSYICGHVTDTRLMGVLYMYMRWMTEDEEIIHMFFYLDAEETGFETFRTLHGDDYSEAADIEMEMAGGLGGRMVELEEKEAKALLQEYAEFNRVHKLPMPQGFNEYSFLLVPVELSPKERRVLLSKQCTKIRSEYQLIHYFLMRCFGHDFKIAKLLATEDVRPDIYDELKKASYYRNAIADSGKGTYICESLVESANRYHIIVSEIAVRDGKIIYFENCSDLAITTPEVAMILARSEYINCYDIMVDVEKAEKYIRRLARNSMMTRHESGNLYMLFNEDNSHVDGPVFQMNEDVYGVYYVTKSGEILAAAYDEENIAAMHESIKECGLSRCLAVTGKYEFTDPVLYDFVTSGLESFEQFIEYISE